MAAEIRRYAPEEFVVYDATDTPALRVVSGDGGALGAVADETLTVDPEADPPWRRIEAMRANDPKFAQTWEHKRGRDLADQSPSGYEMSLIGLMVRAEVPDQEIVNACMYWRTRHGLIDPDKLRPGYYRQSIARARAGQSETALAAAADVPLPEAADDGERARGIAWLANELQVPLVRVVRRGSAEPNKLWTYLVLDDGREVDLGLAPDVLDIKRTRARLHEAVGATIGVMKPERWFAICGLLARVAEAEPIEESAQWIRFAGWLRDYLSGRSADDAEAFKAAVVSSKPFTRDGRVFVHAPRFRLWLALDQGERVENAQVLVWLKQAGFTPRDITVRNPKSRAVTRSYWTGPDTVLERRGSAPVMAIDPL